MNAPLLHTPAAPGANEAAQDAQDAAGASAAPLAAVETEPGWRAAARRAAQVAAQHADAVDRDARFPHEAFDALRRERLLSAMLAPELGGMGLPVADIATICGILAEACASTGMIYAMHQIQVACIDEHRHGSAWHRDFLAQLADKQWLLASATSEETIGGNTRTSACAVELDGDDAAAALRIEKLATAVSYGAYADSVLMTARRNAEAAASDQVLIVTLPSNTTLEKRGTWDSLGMRGTCTEPFRIVSHGTAAQILPTPFADISDQTMLPISHMLWSSVWTGVATDAVNRAKAFFRAQARAKPGSVPPAGLRLAQAVGLLQMMQARLAVALDADRAAHAARQRAGDQCQFDAPLAAMLGFASDMNTLKTSISATALQVVQEVLMICGLAGYKNGTEYSVGRHLRDLHSAPLMINNDRIAQNTANLLLAQRPAAPGRA